MAKRKQDLSGIFTKTEEDPKAVAGGHDPMEIDLDAGNIRPLGIGLREGEIEALQAIADQNGLKRNAVTRFLIRWGIRQYQAGAIDLADYEAAPEVKKTLNMP